MEFLGLVLGDLKESNMGLPPSLLYRPEKRRLGATCFDDSDSMFGR